MALTILQVLVLGVVAAAVDDVPVTWWAGSRAELPCVVPNPAPGLSLPRPPPLLSDDSPKPRQLIWRRNNTEISKKRILPNGALVVNREDEGVYQCVTPQHRGLVLGLPINLKFASIDEQFTKHPENATARAGQPHAISCEIRSAPVATLSWLKDGYSLTSNARYHVLAYQLLILDVRNEDAGVYVCIASNPYDGNRTSYSGTLQVEHSNEDLEPSLLPLHYEEHVIVQRGTKVVLPCPVLGWPRPTLKWEHTPPGGDRGETEHISEVLVLPFVELDVAGNYSCLVEEDKFLVKEFKVTVTTPVVITEPPEQSSVTRTVPRASTTRFSCNTAGHPPPTVTWYKDGVPLPPEKILVNREKQQLLISGVTSEDAGIYECVARSAGGAAAAWAALAVRGAAAAAPRGLRCLPRAAAAVRLAWARAQPNDTYVVQHIDTDVGTPKIITRMPHPNTTETVALKHALTLYKFQVRAFVKVGSSHQASDLSEEVTCQGQGVPIKLIKLHNGTVFVSWRQFATSNPGVVEWILQYRNSTDIYNITLPGHVYNYTFHVPSSPVQVRLLGSRSKVWLQQDLSLVPWTSTADLDHDHRNSIPAPTNVTIVPDVHSLMVRWSHEIGEVRGEERSEHDGGEGAGYVYEVCIMPKNGDEVCQDSYAKSLYIKKFKHNTDYSVRVRAKDPARSRISDFSAPQHITTVAEGGSDRPPQLYYMFTQPGRLRVWWGDGGTGSGRDGGDVGGGGKEGESGDKGGGVKGALHTVHYSSELTLPVDRWPSINTTGNSVLITGLEPTQETYVVVIRHESDIYSNVLNVPPQINGSVLHDLNYEYFPNEIRVSWSAPSLRFVKYSQNLTLPMENWTRVNATGNSVLLEKVNVSLPTYVSVSVSETQWHVPILTFPPQPATQLVYLVAGLVVGVIALALAITGIWFWKKRKQNQSPLRSRRRNAGKKSNEEDGSEMKSVGGRLANGGSSTDAGEPLLNGHVHIIENPTSKTPNGKMKRGRAEAAFDLSRAPDATPGAGVAGAGAGSGTEGGAGAGGDTGGGGRLSRSSRDLSANDSFAKLPDDNMNSELTRSRDFDLESSKIQPTLQPNG